MENTKPLSTLKICRECIDFRGNVICIVFMAISSSTKTNSSFIQDHTLMHASVQRVWPGFLVFHFLHPNFTKNKMFSVKLSTCSDGPVTRTETRQEKTQEGYPTKENHSKKDKKTALHLSHITV